MLSISRNASLNSDNSTGQRIFKETCPFALKQKTTHRVCVCLIHALLLAHWALTHNCSYRRNCGENSPMRHHLSIWGFRKWNRKHQLPYSDAQVLYMYIYMYTHSQRTGLLVVTNSSWFALNQNHFKNKKKNCESKQNETPTETVYMKFCVTGISCVSTYIIHTLLCFCDNQRWNRHSIGY